MTVGHATGLVAATCVAWAVLSGCDSVPTTADDELVEWASGYCSALRPMAVAELDAEDLSAPQTRDVHAMADEFQALEAAYAETTAALEAHGPPPFADGDGLHRRVVDGMTDVGSSYGDLGAELRAVDPADSAAVDTLLVSASDEILGHVAVMRQALSDPRFLDAVRRADGCEGLGFE